MCAKFEQRTHNSFLCIMFIRLFLYFPIMTFTFDPENSIELFTHNGHTYAKFNKNTLNGLVT